MKNKTFSIKTSNDKNLGIQIVEFEGDLGIKNAEAIKKTIQTIRFSGSPVEIHLKNTEKLDITTIQIVRALRTKLVAVVEKVNVSSELSEDINRILKNSGFDKNL